MAWYQNISSPNNGRQIKFSIDNRANKMQLKIKSDKKRSQTSVKL